MKTLYLYTSNSGKLKEFQQSLESFCLKTLPDLKVKETANSFEQNALLKAKAALKALKEVPEEGFLGILAEDSGLQVEALNGAPGIFSARYGQTNNLKKPTDRDNNLKLLKALEKIEEGKRKAQFYCALCFLSPKGQSHFFQGLLKGRISQSLSQGEGFGYDFCFIPEGETETLATLGFHYKKRVSHRAKALKKLMKFLQKA